jgi:hypothetical protein
MKIEIYVNLIAKKKIGKYAFEKNKTMMNRSFQNLINVCAKKIFIN